MSFDARLNWKYRPSTDIYGEIRFALPGVLDPRPRAYEGESNSFDHADVPLTGRDARYFFARFGGLSEASHAHTDADAADKANATLNGTLTLYAVAPLRPRPQGYEVSLDALVAPVRGIVDRGAFTAAVVAGDGVTDVVAPTPLVDGGPRLNAIRSAVLDIAPRDEAGARVALNLSFALARPVRASGRVLLGLPGFTACASEHPDDFEGGSGFSLDAVRSNDRGVVLVLIATENTAVGTHLFLPKTFGLAVGSEGVASDGPTLATEDGGNVDVDTEAAPLAPTPLGGAGAPRSVRTDRPFRRAAARQRRAPHGRRVADGAHALRQPADLRLRRRVRPRPDRVRRQRGSGRRERARGEFRGDDGAAGARVQRHGLFGRRVRRARAGI